MRREFRGIPAAGGLAGGPALHWADNALQIPDFKPADFAADKARLAAARREAEEQLHALAGQVSHSLGQAEAALLEAQAMFLSDMALVSRAEDGIDAGANAERAWQRACEHFALQLAKLPDETLQARAADVRDVGRRVVEVLLGVQPRAVLVGPSVILARDLAPSQTAALDASKVLAFCTAEGGPTSHTAILARALGIPAVVGVGAGIFEIPNEVQVLVDGGSGAIVVDPSSDEQAAFEQRLVTERRQRELDTVSAAKPALTLDGHRIEVVANVGSVEDARKALTSGAEGIGLLRTEFLFINRSQLPDEQTQFAAYKTILDLMGARPVVVRTLDVGGDKEVPYYDFGREANPFLGYRAIRISLERPEEFRAQLRALLRAGSGHDLRIMFPMIATLAEVRAARKLLDEARLELEESGIIAAERVQAGIMVEIPSAALLADQFAQEVDFFSIGTNDLTQYTLAAERGNKRLAHLSDPCHPAVLRQIQHVAAAAHQAGIWVGVCGEMAGDLQAMPLLLGLGVDELSVAPGQIPAAKQAVRNWSLARAQELAAHALNLDSAQAVRAAVDAFKNL
jgi:phosphoenolpyruvate-protein phosphotransferase